MRLIFTLCILLVPVASGESKDKNCPVSTGPPQTTSWHTFAMQTATHCVWCVPSHAVISYRGKLDSKGSHLGLFALFFFSVSSEAEQALCETRCGWLGCQTCCTWPWGLGLGIPSPCGLNFATNMDIGRKLKRGGRAEMLGQAIVHSCLIVLCSWDSIRLCVLLKKQVHSVFIFVYSKRRGWNLG